jgi:lipoate-protein ligase B
MSEMHFVWLGRREYHWSWSLQRRLHAKRCSGSQGDVLLLTEHDPVYTIGRSGNDHHLLAGADELERRKIPVVHNDRGGDITYHGPGQLVGYPILDLRGFTCDLHRYLRDLEEAIIRTLDAYTIRGRRESQYTGVWVGSEKICAIGIKTRQWVTMHGFALNVNTDLRAFDRIIPCGIFERGVTSMEQVLGRPLALEEVAGHVVEAFGLVFGRTMREVRLEEEAGESEGRRRVLWHQR